MESDPPYWTIRTAKLSFRFLLGDDDSPETADNVDAVITAPDGTRWSATLLTRSAIDRVMDRWATTGECLDGRYFQVQDLVIVRDAGLDSMVKALEDIFDMYGLNTDVLPKLGPVEDMEEDEEEDA